MSCKAPRRPPRRSRANPWREDPDDGTFTVGITLDYDDLWRGREKEVSGTIEHDVVYLTAEQKLLLERSPREFLELRPRPESAELVHFRTQIIGGSQRVVELIVAAAPKSPDPIRHLAIAPNLVPLERQLAGLCTVRLAADDGPLAPLRALLGLRGGEDLPTPAAVDRAPGRRVRKVRLRSVRTTRRSPSALSSSVSRLRVDAESIARAPLTSRLYSASPSIKTCMVVGG